MRTLLPVIVLAAVAMPAAPAFATTTEQRLDAEAELGRIYHERVNGRTGCEDGFQISVFNDPAGPTMRGGFCRIEANAYWLRPNRWGMDLGEECALVFHEVGHALPDGTEGGVDGQGHTASGLMSGEEVSVVPRLCRRFERQQHREARAVRLGLMRGPAKGVIRG